MTAIVKWSVVLALLVTVLSLTIMVTGMHTNPIIGSIGSILIAIVLNVVVVVLALRQTAADCTYGRQLLNGVTFGLMAGVLVFLSSWLMLAVVFPNTLDEMRAGYTTYLQAAGLPEAQVQQQIEAMKGMTPVNQSLSGLLGTFFTSVIVAAIAGIFLKKK